MRGREIPVPIEEHPTRGVPRFTRGGVPRFTRGGFRGERGALRGSHRGYNEQEQSSGTHRGYYERGNRGQRERETYNDL